MSFDSLPVTRRIPTLIIGSGYAPIGYALATGECLIVEQGELCDAHFYLPMRQFAYEPYLPKTPLGEELLFELSRLSLLRDGMQNVCGFECALCSFLKKHPVDILLKCRVTEVERAGDGYLVTLITNSGLERIYAERVLNMKEGAPSARRYLTVLLSAGERFCADSLLDAFEGAVIEPAFYDGRWALYLPMPKTAELNLFKRDLYRALCQRDLDAKLLYFAPVPHTLPDGDAQESSVLFDGRYRNPVEALEAGIRYAGGKEK